MLKQISILILLIIVQTGFTQNEDLFNRLRARHGFRITSYNVDGINFTNNTSYIEYNEKNLKKAYRQNKIKQRVPKTSDTELNYENYKVVDRREFGEGLVYVNVYYFVKNKQNQISSFWFGYYSKSNPEFERRMIDLIMGDKIPKSCFSSTKTNNIDFVGREIELGGNCNWVTLNNIQCPYYGQMNWSIHKTKESADLAVENQFKTTKSRNGGKVISEEDIEIIFEGVPTKAKKILYDFTGVTSLLASMSGGKHLIIYYVSEKVRGNYVSCVLSFWNNDSINPSGLPPLLEKVMKISRK